MDWHRAVSPSPKQLRLVLAIAAIMLVLVHVFFAFVAYYTGHDYNAGLTPAFDLDEEFNVPAIYQSMTLLLCSTILAGIGIQSRTASRAMRAGWFGLAGVFAFLFFDELLGIHEMLTPVLREQLHAGGVLHFTWVIPYGLFAMLFGLAYLRFLYRLPRVTALLMMAGGVIFLSGTVGAEMLGGQLYPDEFTALGYRLLVGLEEGLEMLGIAVFAPTVWERLRSLRQTEAVAPSARDAGLGRDRGTGLSGDRV